MRIRTVPSSCFLLLLLFASASAIGVRTTAGLGGLVPGSTQASSNSHPLKTRAVVLIVLDGLRGQEIFDGPEHDLMNSKIGGVQDVEQLRKDFWRATPEEGRQALMPFLWNVVAKGGQIYGNQYKGSIAQVTNGFKFSYPGYNEMTTGYADPRINSNEFGVNPNVTVFEWLNNWPAFHDQVAIFGTWNVFNDIFRAKTSGLLVRAGWDLP